VLYIATAFRANFSRTLVFIYFPKVFLIIGTTASIEIEALDDEPFSITLRCCDILSTSHTHQNFFSSVRHTCG